VTSLITFLFTYYSLLTQGNVGLGTLKKGKLPFIQDRQAKEAPGFGRRGA